MISINLYKARAITHDKRRVARAAEFAPLDEQIARQIPGTDQASIEVERQMIRDRYDAIQKQIDGAGDVGELSEIIAGL